MPQLLDTLDRYLDRWQGVTCVCKGGVGRVNERVLGQVGVPLGGLNLCVTQDLLNLVQAPASVDQKASE